MAVIYGFALYRHMPLMNLHPQLFDIKGIAYSVAFHLSNLNTTPPLIQQEGQHLSLSLVTLIFALSFCQGC